LSVKQVGSVKIIDQGKQAIVERFGRYQRSLKPGLNFAIPLIDTVIVESVREQVLNIAPQSAITKDSIRIKFDALIFWRILDISRAYYAVEDLEEALINIAIASIRSEISNLNLNEVEYSKNKVDEALLHDLDKATAAWAVKVLRVEIQDIIISESEPQTNAVSELDLLHVELPGEIDWLAYNKTVEKIFLEKEVEVITQGWKILDEGIKARTLVNIKTFPPGIGKDRIRSDFLISYGFYKNEIDNSKFERTYSGTDEKFKEDVKNMFQQIQGQLQTLMISTSKEINITLNNLNDLSCLSFKFLGRSSRSKGVRDQNMQFRCKTA
jgi:hypothetical protein